SPQQAEEYLRAAGIDPKTRGEALGVADFERLAAAGAAPGSPDAHESPDTHESPQP
ncbi:MAG: 16S rRNA (adenine(1518)-N(6)/adenine(1519)-N(6))-dimethyltransferase, partial [Brevibacterium aurantiacum]|nr:16S rRNA (adenine(1518)-N(6)/adenine(1519)-N(6))-dimethyltransferase [Brevibacterium aurantiacum]